MPSNTPEYTRQWYEKNKIKHLEKYREKIYCEYCDCYVSRSAISNHKKTKKHELHVKLMVLNQESHIEFYV